MLTLNSLVPLLQDYPMAEPALSGQDIRRAAVCMILQSGVSGAELIMIKRAEYKADPWSGHMAFPGGRIETFDKTAYHAAVRECDEELGVDLNDSARLLTRLPDATTLGSSRLPKMAVSAYVFESTETLAFKPNREVAEVVAIPLSFFAEEANRDSFVTTFHGESHELDCYDYRQYRVWGLSLRFIDKLISVSMAV